MKELLMDENVRRMQEVVDKEPYHDDQATDAITVGLRRHKIVGYIVFLMSYFLNSL